MEGFCVGMRIYIGKITKEVNAVRSPVRCHIVGSIGEPRPGQKNRNYKAEPEPNQNTQNQNRTKTLKYQNGFYISLSEITEPNREPNGYPKM